MVRAILVCVFSFTLSFKLPFYHRFYFLKLTHRKWFTLRLKKTFIVYTHHASCSDCHISSFNYFISVIVQFNFSLQDTIIRLILLGSTFENRDGRLWIVLPAFNINCVGALVFLPLVWNQIFSIFSRCRDKYLNKILLRTLAWLLWNLRSCPIIIIWCISNNCAIH